MRIDRSHFSWLLGTLVATALATLFYLANFHPGYLPFHLPLPAFLGEAPPVRLSRGATPLGLIFGATAFAIFLFASALGIRKKRRLWPIGNVRFWLKAHIWLSILTIPLVAYHCDFHASGSHARWLLVLYVVVMASGFFGLALQQFVPAAMKDQLPREVIFEQIPRLRSELLASALEMRESLREEARSASSETDAGTTLLARNTSPQALVKFLDETCLPYLSAKRGERLALGARNHANGVFRGLRSNVSAEWASKVNLLEQWCRERRWMDLQTRYQHWLHGWLLVHVPSSFALLIFTAWHAWATVRFLVG